MKWKTQKQAAWLQALLTVLVVLSSMAFRPLDQPVIQTAAIQPDQVIASMKAHYEAQGIETKCIPYRAADVEIAQVVSVYDHNHYKVIIPARNASLEISLVGVSGHAQEGKDAQAKDQARAVAQGQEVLLIRTNVDQRGGAYVRYVVTKNGLILNFEVMDNALVHVSSIEDNACYPIMVARSNAGERQ